MPSDSHNEKTILLLPKGQKLEQNELQESKNTGSVQGNIFLRYIRASTGGIIGTIFILFLFLISSSTALLANWWLGRWSDAENIRHTSNTSGIQCSHNRQSIYTNMTMDEWQSIRDNYLFKFIGKSLDEDFPKMILLF